MEMQRLKKKTFVIPMPPTPDSDLHLGHAAGPYLSSDIFVRAFRELGYDCVFTSGVDAFENWCSELGERRIGELRDSHVQALSYLGVEFDSFHSPLSPVKRGVYEDAMLSAFLAFKQLPSFRTISEKVHVSRRTGKFGFGAEITGLCPRCHASVRGNACISCFNYLQPSQLLSPRMTAHLPNEVDEVEVDNDFVVLNDIPETELSSRGISRFGINNYLDWSKSTGSLFRLTYQGAFGVRSPGREDRVLRNSFIQYCHFLVSLHSEDRKQECEIYTFMGYDNFIPCVVGTLGLSPAMTGMSFKNFTLNHMLNYRGTKFSKSKNHGPTLKSVSTRSEKHIDESYRVFLAGLDLGLGVCDFTDENFDSFHSEYLKLKESVRLSIIEEGFDGDAKSHQNFAHEILTGFVSGKLSRSELVTVYLGAMKSVALKRANANTRTALCLARVVDPKFHSRVSPLNPKRG